jgi:hypothetical protein
MLIEALNAFAIACFALCPDRIVPTLLFLYSHLTPAIHSPFVTVASLQLSGSDEFSRHRSRSPLATAAPRSLRDDAHDSVRSAYAAASDCFAAWRFSRATSPNPATCSVSLPTPGRKPRYTCRPRRRASSSSTLPLNLMEPNQMRVRY